MVISIANNNKRDYLSICNAWKYLWQCDSFYIYLFFFIPFCTHKCTHCQWIQHKNIRTEMIQQRQSDWNCIFGTTQLKLINSMSLVKWKEFLSFMCSLIEEWKEKIDEREEYHCLLSDSMIIYICYSLF